MIIIDIEELRSSPNIITSKITALTRATNKQDWSKYPEVFEKTAQAWAQGIYNPDIRELTPGTGIKRVWSALRPSLVFYPVTRVIILLGEHKNTQIVRDAFGAIFAIEFFESRRRQLNKGITLTYTSLPPLTRLYAPLSSPYISPPRNMGSKMLQTNKRRTCGITSYFRFFSSRLFSSLLFSSHLFSSHLFSSHLIYPLWHKLHEHVSR